MHTRHIGIIMGIRVGIISKIGIIIVCTKGSPVWPGAPALGGTVDIPMGMR